MDQAVRSYRALIAQLSAKAGRDGFVLIAVDGCGGAGKSTFARGLCRHAGPSQLVQFDDFYQPSSNRKSCVDASSIGSLFDWRRLEREVLQPLSQGMAARYQRYDWDSGTLAEWHDVLPTGLVVIEGVYSARLELAAYYSFVIWLETAADERLRRGIARDGEASRQRWQHEWMPAEAAYVRAHFPRQRADVVIDGSGQIPHDPDAEIVCINL